MSVRMTALMSLLACAGLPAAAMTNLFDFESPDELASWTIRIPTQDTWEQADTFVTSAGHSAVFRSPKWKEGMPEWPALETTPPVADWTQFDRLIMDVTNPTAASERFAVYIRDAHRTLQQGRKFDHTLPPCSTRRIVIPLAKLPEDFDRTKMDLIHFFTSRPVDDYVVYIDNIALLRKGEAPPDLPTAFNEQIVALVLDAAMFDEVREELERARARLAKTPKGRSSSPSWTMAQVNALLQELADLEQSARQPGIPADRATEVREAVTTLPDRLARIESLAALRKAWHGLGGRGPYVVGFASSMEKVLPRAMPVDLTVSDCVTLSLARNEWEAFQVAVLPFDAPLEDVRIEVGALKDASGRELPAEAMDVRVVGYVKTERPPYSVPHVGWWPDPLLDFLSEVDIAQGDCQAFWVRVRTPKDCASGVYRGPVRVVPSNAGPWEFDLQVRVYDFALPDRAPLPTAMSVYEGMLKKVIQPDDWDAYKLTAADFLADYFIDYDSLYLGDPPDMDILKHLYQRGRLEAFNMLYMSSNTFKGEMTEQEVARTLEGLLPKLRATYAAAKEGGFADKAYIYGFDERGEEYFPIVQQVAATLGAEFPDVPFMTTTYDHSYGLETVMKDVDIWVPLTPRFSPDQVAAAREQGRDIWWYICIGPKHPYANWLIEYPAIEARLLMGFMTAKYRPGGFLYYAVTRWPVNDGPIQDGPFTDWNPASYKDNNGDGSLLCAGPDGRLLATIRLENFREGLEDYAYIRLLEDRVAALRLRSEALSEEERALLLEVEQACEVPVNIVASLTEYTRDPNELYAYRRNIAHAIEQLAAVGRP